MEEIIHGGDIYRNQIQLDYSVNTNMLGIPAAVKQALHEAVEECDRYPDILVEELRHQLGMTLRIPTEQILCGNGASELFQSLMHALNPKKVLLPVPSFYGYQKVTKAVGAKTIFYQMRQENGFALDEGFLEELKEDIDLVFLANPNNPVGNTINPQLLEKIMERCRRQEIKVVLDECFLSFLPDNRSRSMISHVNQYPNVMVLRAFTKIFAIPGVRLGYLVGSDEMLMEQISDQLPEWNVSLLAQKAGIAALQQTEFLSETIGAVAKERSYLEQELKNMGIQVLPGEANFMLLYTQKPLYEKLLNRGILVRDCSNYIGLEQGYYRIAVKTRQENEQLLKEIRNG